MIFRATVILLAFLAAALVPGCGSEDEPSSVGPTEEALQPTPEELADARQALIQAVVAPDANPGTDLVAPLLRLRASSDAEDRIFGGSHLYLLGILNEVAPIAEFVRAYVPREGNLTEFDAWVFLTKGHLRLDDPPAARPLLERALALWNWSEDDHENIPRLLLRQLDLVPGTRSRVETLRTQSGDVAVNKGRVLLFFSLVGCGPCRRGYAECVTALTGEQGGGANVILIMRGEDPESALAGFDFPHRLVRVESTSPDLTTEFGITSYPFYYVLEDGVVLHQGRDIEKALRAAGR